MIRALALSLLLTSPAFADENFTRLGDALQIALPAAAIICAIRQDRGRDTIAGYVAQNQAWRGVKSALKHHPLNRRPDGTWRGFPSGHSADAMFGATNLAEKCYPDKPALRIATYGLALAVGLSRIDADRHTPLQVGAGFILGHFANGLTVSNYGQQFAVGYSMQF